MQLQTNPYCQGTTFSVFGDIETSVSSNRDSSFTHSSLLKSEYWHSAREIGSTQMTPLAQSFQTLYNTLEQLSYSLDDMEADAEVSPVTIQDGLIQSSSQGLGTSDAYLFSERKLLASEGSVLNLAHKATVATSHLTDSVASTTGHSESSDSSANFGADSALLTGSLVPVSSGLPIEGDKASVSDQTPLLRTKIAADVALALDNALSESASLVDGLAYKNDSDVILLPRGAYRQHTSNPNELELAQRFKLETLFSPYSDSLRAEMNVLAQYASSMQSHTPSSLKVNDASWKTVFSQLQPISSHTAISPSTINTLTNTLAVSAENLASVIDNLGSRATSTNLIVEKSLPIEAQRQMYQVVKDKVQLQLDMNSQVARIRFDPPELGRMEMVLRIEGDKLTVQISATAATTREVLMATSERLRHELIAQNSALSEVDVALSQQQHSANPEQYLASFVEHDQEDVYDEASPSVPEYTAYIARV